MKYLPQNISGFAWLQAENPYATTVYSYGEYEVSHDWVCFDRDNPSLQLFTPTNEPVKFEDAKTEYESVEVKIVWQSSWDSEWIDGYDAVGDHRQILRLKGYMKTYSNEITKESIIRDNCGEQEKYTYQQVCYLMDLWVRNYTHSQLTAITTKLKDRCFELAQAGDLKGILDLKIEEI